MKRLLLPLTALLCIVVAVALIATAHELNPGPMPTRAAVLPERVIVRETVVVEVRAILSPSPTRQPTSTPLPNCEVAMFQGTVCRWATATAILPLPTCGPNDPGLTCVRQGPIQATISRPTATPTFALGVVVKEGRER